VVFKNSHLHVLAINDTYLTYSRQYCSKQDRKQIAFNPQLLQDDYCSLCCRMPDMLH